MSKLYKRKLFASKFVYVHIRYNYVSTIVSNLNYFLAHSLWPPCLHQYIVPQLTLKNSIPRKSSCNCSAISKASWVTSCQVEAYYRCDGRAHSFYSSTLHIQKAKNPWQEPFTGARKMPALFQNWFALVIL